MVCWEIASQTRLAIKVARNIGDHHGQAWACSGVGDLPAVVVGVSRSIEQGDQAGEVEVGIYISNLSRIML